MQLHTLQRRHKNKKSVRIGRGGKRGKTSGRGHKGQKARAGRKLRPEIRDMIKRLPKRRGYGKNRARTVNSGKMVAIPVSLSAIEKNFESGAVITPSLLLEKKIVFRQGNSVPRVKILADGTITKSVTIEQCAVSASAADKIRAAGGSIKV